MVVVYGDLLFDVLVFEEGNKVPASDAQAKAIVVPGGSAFNTARHIASRNVKTLLLGAVGKEGGYSFFLEAAKAYNVELMVRRCQGFTGTLLVRHEGAERHMWSSPNSSRQEAPLPKEPFDWLHISAYAIFGTDSARFCSQLIELARSYNAILSVDAASYEPLKAHKDLFLRMTEGFDYLFANEDEIAVLTDLPYQHVVVKRGPKGAVVDGVEVPAPKVDAVSTLGAGDCFDGVCIAELSRGTSLVDAVKIAVEEASKWVALPIEQRYGGGTDG
ncbi:carbohydrate kinase family protein [Coprothermobacteraceae bacterium]|nr:carbohydrate kinase family protein [Coprothermobacteraceae bacterium]